jgi:hypothetical protein
MLCAVTDMFDFPQALLNTSHATSCLLIICIFSSRSLYGKDARRLPERTNEMAGVYASQCIELAKEMDVHCVDIWSKMQAAEGWQKLYLR